MAQGCFAQISGLTRFVLGLYISLSLSRTYYANRSVFGTVFGSTMGFAQQVAAWVQAPKDHSNSESKAQCAQYLLVRWVNAAYRLLVLEVRGGLDAESIGATLVQKQLLTDREWSHIAGRTSRATHIYQWVNNVLVDLVKAGYIQDTYLLVSMHEEIDKMRGANVWGLPSLPLPYTLMITAMVKIHLFFMAAYQGGNLRRFWPETMTLDSAWDIERAVVPVVAVLFEMFIQNFIYQGMLDLHGWLYSPNGGELLGHLPADNFLDFVQTVTIDMVSESGCCVPERLPYTLELTKEDSLESKTRDSHAL